MPGRRLFRFKIDRARLRVDSAFVAKQEGVEPHSRVRVDHFQLDCFERLQSRVSGRVRVRTDVIVL